MNPRRLLLLQDHLRSGGTERQTILLARAFRARGHEVEVLTFRPGGALAPTLAPVPHRCIQPFDTGLNFFAPGLARAVRRFDPGVVLLMGRMAHALGGGLATRLPRARVVATLRTGKPLPALYRRTLRGAAHVVANSAESAARLVGPLGLPAARVSVIHNALVFPSPPASGEAAAGPLRAATRAELDAPPGAVVLLCVAMFRPEKNQRALLEAAARLPGPPHAPDWRLWLVGEGPARAGCEALATRLGLGARVRFLGFRDDPRPLYAAADLAVLASRAESLSNFLVEAQSHRLPVVAARATGVGECFLPGVSGTLVEPDDPEAFARALGPWLAEPARRAAAGAAGAAHAREAFAPAARADDYLGLFERLLTAPRD